MSDTLVQPLSPGNLTLSQGTASIVPVGFGYYPEEGSRVVTCQYNWGVQTSYAEDMSQLEARGVFTAIQSVFVDNSANLNSVAMTFQGTGHTLICPASSQAIFPLFVTGQAAFLVQSSVAGLTASQFASQVTRLYLMNTPANSGGVWAAPALGAASQQQAVLPSTMIKNVSVSQAIRQGGVAGRVFKVFIIATIAGSFVTIIDNSNPTVTPANTIFVIPVGTLQGTVFDLNAPYINGLSAAFDTGATGTIALTFGP